MAMSPAPTKICGPCGGGGGVVVDPGPSGGLPGVGPTALPPPHANTPAQAAGLQAGDRIVAVNGVDAATFDATFDSSEVDARMQRATALARQYGIVATPTLVVGGRYATNPTLASADSKEPFEAMLAIVDQLVADIRACRDRCAEAAPER